MKIPFDIKFRPQIESGEYKVVIYMGNSPTEECSVEILKWDSNSDAGCIVGCFQVKGKDKIYVFDKNGEHKVFGIKGNRLYIITSDPKLTEFEKAVKNMLSPYVKMPDEIHKEKAAKLLELARIQLIEEQLTSDPRKTDLYKLGKEEALKDLPRWKKATGKERSNERMIVLAFDNDLLCTNYAEEGEYYISFSELEKLPKEG